MAIAACLAPRSAECQGAPAPTRSHIRVLSLDTLPPESPWTTITERIYRERLSDAFGDRLAYYYERLDSYNFPDSSYESDFEDYLLRKYHDRPFDLLLVGGTHRGRLCRAPASAARGEPADRVPGQIRRAAGSEIGRRQSRVCAERVAGPRASRASGDTPRVRRERCRSRAINGTTTCFRRRCLAHRSAWTSPTCEGSPSRRWSSDSRPCRRARLFCWFPSPPTVRAGSIARRP